MHRALPPNPPNLILDPSSSILRSILPLPLPYRFVSSYTVRRTNLFSWVALSGLVCNTQGSHCIATVFVVGSSFAFFSLGEHVNTLSDLLDFSVNHELRDVYADYVSLILFHPQRISLQQNSGTLLRSSPSRYVRLACTVVQVCWRLHFVVVTRVFAVYAQSEKFVSFCAYELSRPMNSSIIPHLKMLLNTWISCSI
jgi:hypothetical protein